MGELENKKNKEDELIRNLQDTGMSASEIKHFMTCFGEGESQTWMRILKKQRSNLLTDVHAGQERLYCLDFLMRKLDIVHKNQK